MIVRSPCDDGRGMSVIVRMVVGSDVLAPGRALFPSFVKLAGAAKGSPDERLADSPQAIGLARQKQRFREMLADKIEIVNDNHDRPIFAMPALDQFDQVADGLGIDSIEWLIEQDDIGVLHQHPREQAPAAIARRTAYRSAAFRSRPDRRHQRMRNSRGPPL